MTDGITSRQFSAAEGVSDWRMLSEGACAHFRTGSFVAGVKLVQAIGGLEGVDDGHASVDLRNNGVTVRLLTKANDWWGVSRRDIELAQQISALAREQRVAADPSVVQTLLLVPGAPDITKVMPFWRAILGYEPRADSPAEDLVDPHGLGPGFWFETMDEPRADGGGAIHLAVWVPYEQAEARIAAALAAGGHMVRDQFAPAWWTLADAADNEVDIATAMNRD